MKKIIIPLIMIAGIFTSCNNSAEEKKQTKTEDSEALTIKGHISDGDGDMLYFEKLTPSDLKALDSVKLDSDGNFSFSHDAKVVDLYRLRVDNDGVFLVGNPGENIEFTVNKRPISRHYEISGSSESELAREMNQHLVDAADKLQAMGEEYKAAQNKSEAEQQEILERLNKEANQLIEEEKEFLSEMIRDNEESIFIYLALFQQLGQNPVFAYPEDEDMFEFVSAKLEEHNPESPFTKSLKSDITKMKRQAEEQEGPGAGYGVGDMAPDIAMENPDGVTKNLHSLRGNYVLLDFWAGWCRPCRIENPNLVSTYNKYKSENFTIFQVSLDKDRETWVEAIEKDNLSQWTHVSDLKYWNSEAARQYGVKSIPASFLLNPEGEIIATNLRDDALGEKLEEIFGH
ncbi:MAG: thioredoxin-like domain-containing protein [Bacteroidales bacterium]